MRRSYWLVTAALGALTLFAAAQAFATAGNGAVSTYMARGPVSQSVVRGWIPSQGSVGASGEDPWLVFADGKYVVAWSGTPAWDIFAGSITCR